MTYELTLFYQDIASLLKIARAKAYQAVNSLMVETYWQIGRRIVEEEQGGKHRAAYGERLIENLSKYLNAEFGKGFSEANLQNMRKFYLCYPNFPKLSDNSNSCEFPTQCVGNLSWTNVRRIIRIDNPQERDYYLLESAQQNWTSRQLERNIKTGYYQRLLSHQKNEQNILEVVPEESFIKDPYVLEFLNLPENINGKESLLENAIINHLQQFLLELGKGFSFVARQFRISTETEHFYIDLVFYNYLLKCFVIIDLKTRKLNHSDIGQMDMYVRMFDNLKRSQDDNPTLGIILCQDKSETMVKYSVLNENKQIFASKYQTILPSEEELAQLLGKYYLDE